MRHVPIGAAAFAVCGVLASTAANAETFRAGGPERIGSMCRVNADFANPEMDDFGYYAPCGYNAVAQAPVHHHRADRLN